MNRPSVIVALGDLILLFLLGASLSYIDFYVVSTDMKILMSATFVVSFILGSFGPSLGEVIEWVLFFSLGVFATYLYPQYLEYQATQSFSVTTLLINLQHAIFYSIQLLTPWCLGIPLGYTFHKITSYSYFRRNSY